MKPEAKQACAETVKDIILAIFRKQVGFLEILPFFSEPGKEQKVVAISLWATKGDAERYENEFYPKVQEIVKPYLLTPIVIRPYTLETTLCEHFVETLVA